MKTFKRTIPAYCGIMAVLLLGFAVLCGCAAGEDGDNKPNSASVLEEIEGVDVLDKETEQQIRHDYWYGYLRPIFNSRAGIFAIEVTYYLGTYNGCVAVMMWPPISELALAVISGYKVADTKFTFGDSAGRIFVWKQMENTEGEYYTPRDDHVGVNSRVREAHDLGLLPFYDLRDAYDLGLVTADDVRSIAERYYGKPYKDDGQGGHPISRFPTIFTPEELEELAKVEENKAALDKETEQQIRQDYLYGYYRPILGRTNGSLDDVKVNHYLGTYHGYEVVIMRPEIFAGGGAVLCSMEVANETFVFGGPTPRIFVWKPGERDQYYKPRDAHDLAGWKDIVNERVREAHDLGLLSFYELRDAYDLGMVTADDVKSMADRFYGGLKDDIPVDDGIDRFPTIFGNEMSN